VEAAGRPHFGALLRQFRLDAGITQQELAERAKLSVEAIGTLERGARTRPHRDTVALLGRALELSQERETLLISTIGTPHRSRQRERGEALDGSLLRIVRTDSQGIQRNNLPRQLTSFVAREQEIREIAALLREHRLVTVVGTGGVGKTRVAVQVGSDLLTECPDGVWLVDLAPIADQNLAASAVLSALQLAYTARPALDAVVTYLKSRRLLLILDNCEHIIDRARDIVATVTQACPYVRILSTSRQPLNVSGERTYRLPSLEVPGARLGSAHDALAYGAVALFVDRAVAVDASFALTDDNALDVVEICRRLDGIPLAIEMAAARVNVLTPRQIGLRLDQRFRLLTLGDPHALPRHQTMTALIDWSYDLLTPREQRFFESLSVFAGGCTLEEAAAVCATDGEDDVAVIDLLASLVAKSLLLAELAAGEQRYRLLESSRHYAREKLQTRGEQERVARRHALVYLELAERLDVAWHFTPDREWLPKAKVELENWRAALEWALAKQGDVTMGQRLAAARKIVWRCFTLDEGRRWIRAALELVDERTPLALVARLAHAETEGDGYFANRNALVSSQRALALYRELNDVVGTAQMQIQVGGALVLMGRAHEAEPLLHEALQTARRLGRARLLSAVLTSLGSQRSAVDDFVAARAYLADAFELAKAAGADSFATHIAVSIALNESYAGDPEAALRVANDLVASHREQSSSPALTNIAYALTHSVNYLIELGRYDEARVRAMEALESARELGVSALITECIKSFVIASLLRPQVDTRSTATWHTAASLLFGFAEGYQATKGFPLLRSAEYDRALAVLRNDTSADELENLMTAGATMTEDEAIAQAHALV
jgi:predicted ATPase/DNA-binding XRE family transcriptional regulator